MSFSLENLSSSADSSFDPLAGAWSLVPPAVDLDTSVGHARLCFAVTIPALLGLQAERLRRASGGAFDAEIGTDQEKRTVWLAVGDHRLVFGMAMAPITGHGSRILGVVIDASLELHRQSTYRNRRVALARLPFDDLVLFWVEEQVGRFVETLRELDPA